MIGYLNSIETFGTVDGPGVRYVIFLQGCLLKCKYCHNRNTWEVGKQKIIKTVDEMVEDILKYKSFIKDGGITISGGEPLIQSDFCLELFKKMKEHNIHTCLDTAGSILNDSVEDLLNYTDLVLLDIKSINKEIHKELTSFELGPILKFLDYLKSINKKIWIRHVIVPDLTDNKEDLKNLAIFIKDYKSITEKIELLSYHAMGIIKWEQMNLEYPLKNTRVFGKEEFNEIKKYFFDIYNSN